MVAEWLASLSTGQVVALIILISLALWNVTAFIAMLLQDAFTF